MTMQDDLRRWVEAGLIDSDTAAAIEAHESTRSGAGRIGRGMEAIAYLGAVLVLVALVVLATEFWDRIEPWGRLALSAIVALVLFMVGLLLGRSDEPALDRAQTFAWLLTVAAVILTALVAVRDLAGIDEGASFVWVSVTALVTSGLLWWLRDSVLQMVGMAIAAGASVIAVISQIESAPEWAFGLGFAGLGVLWILMTWGGWFRPERTSYALGAIGALLIAFPEGADLPWPLLGLGAGLGLMALSVPLNQSVLLGLGVAGLFVYIPMTIFEVFGESLGIPFALLITGLILLAVVVITVRLRKETRP